MIHRDPLGWRCQSRDAECFVFLFCFFWRKAAVPPVAADPSSHCAHEPLSALITPGGPQGWRVPGGARESEVLTLCSSVLIATLEAPFIRRCALCYFQPPLHVSAGTIKKHWIGKKKPKKKKKRPAQERHQINLRFHRPAFPHHLLESYD